MLIYVLYALFVLHIFVSLCFFLFVFTFAYNPCEGVDKSNDIGRLLYKNKTTEHIVKLNWI